jgi:hypothetical protein
MKRIIASVGIAVALLLAVAPAGVGLLAHTGIASADLVNNDPTSGTLSWWASV